MSGPVLTMAPAVGPAGTFHRSHSTPALYALADSDKSPPALSFEIPCFDTGIDLDTTLSFDREPPKLSRQEEPAQATVTPTPDVAEPDVAINKRARLGRSNTISERTRSWLPSSKSTSNVRDLLSSFTPPSRRDSVSDRDCRTAEPQETSKATRAIRSGSISSRPGSRGSWLQDPSSPHTTSLEPSDVPTLPRDQGPRKSYSRFSRPPGKKDDRNHSADSARSSGKSLTRASIYISKINQRPSSVFGKLARSSDSDTTSRASSSTSLALPTNATDATASNPTSVSDLNSSTDASSLDTSRGGERDPLLPVFKNLELEVGVLEARPMPPSLRMHVVKTTLLPFLQQPTDPESIKSLQPEDVERRAIVFNKWWAMLLDQLGALGVVPTPGVDRASLLEALTLLMMRPEWRQMTSYFQPLSERSPTERVKCRSRDQSDESSSGSTHSAGSANTAEQTVRAMFVANLVRQMELVVGKMAQRAAPVSFVNFCGKACAYAFFFAPGIADVLVRLWGLDTLLIQRVADEFRLPRRSKGESEDIVALFPPGMSDLGWSSIRTMGTSLRRLPPMAARLAKIRWHSPWMTRWRGRDTDLFYIFCKYYHILAEEFMPSGLPLFEKARAPGFVLVHAQILAVLDTTVHRQATIQALGMAPPLSDRAHGVDASATAMPGLPADLLRSMSENRLVALLKDIMSETSAALARSRDTFAEAFMALMKASAKRTSQFNYSACHTLCDFLEEALTVYDNAEVADDPSTHYVDWSFWFNVCKLISESHNSMSEMRVLCLIYTIWDAATRVPKRKEALCLDWLLSEQTFYRFFNHWCPMVRSYFMRLLCWRLCRDTGSANKVDAVFLVVAFRLRTIWSHYVYLKEEAELHGRYPPSSAPCYPTPGKKFMILRSEVNAPPTNVLPGFDTFGKPPTFDELTDRLTTDDVLQSKPDGKKKWALLGLNKVLPFKSDSKSPGDDDVDRGLRLAPPPPPKAGRRGSGTSSPSEPISRAESPVYDASRHVFRFVLNWYPPAAMPPAERILTRPRLPSPAQSWISNAGEPSLVVPGLSPMTRRVSGSAQTGLINEARNASPLDSPEPARTTSSRPSMFSRTTSEKSSSDNSERPSLSVSLLDRDVTGSLDNLAVLNEDSVRPVKPSGVFSKSAVYSGRALAEWSVVVHECNVFVERRREEGVLALADVEVPELAMENYRRVG